MTGRKQQSSPTALFPLTFYISPAHVSYLIALRAQSHFEQSARAEILGDSWGYLRRESRSVACYGVTLWSESWCVL